MFIVHVKYGSVLHLARVAPPTVGHPALVAGSRVTVEKGSVPFIPIYSMRVNGDASISLKDNVPFSPLSKQVFL